MVNELIGQDKLNILTDEIIDLKDELNSVKTGKNPLREYGLHVTYEEFSNTFNALNADLQAKLNDRPSIKYFKMILDEYNK